MKLLAGKYLLGYMLVLAAIALATVKPPLGIHRAATIPHSAASHGAATAPSQGSTATVQTGPRQVHLPVRPGELRVMTIRELGNFDYETDKVIPQDVQRLCGSRLRLSGYMIPTVESEHMHEFDLVPSLFGCCYGQPPAVQHVVKVITSKDHPVEYTLDAIDIEGTLTVKEIKEDGFVTCVFQIAADKVTAAK